MLRLLIQAMTMDHEMLLTNLRMKILMSTCQTYQVVLLHRNSVVSFHSLTIGHCHHYHHPLVIITTTNMD